MVGAGRAGRAGCYTREMDCRAAVGIGRTGSDCDRGDRRSGQGVGGGRAAADSAPEGSAVRRTRAGVVSVDSRGEEVMRLAQAPGLWVVAAAVRKARVQREMLRATVGVGWVPCKARWGREV